MSEQLTAMCGRQSAANVLRDKARRHRKTADAMAALADRLDSQCELTEKEDELYWHLFCMLPHGN